MRRFLTVAATLYLISIGAAAQSRSTSAFDEWKIYGGYQFTSADTHGVQDALNLEHAIDPAFPLLHFGNRQSMNGWDFGMQEDITKWFGVVVDGGAGYSERRILLSSISGVNTSTRTRLRAYTVMAGPQITFSRTPRFEPFARLLIGGGFFRSQTDELENNVVVLPAVAANDSGFAYGPGVGSDILLSHHFGARIAGDYIRTQLFSETQNNFRVTVGLVYRF